MTISLTRRQRLAAVAKAHDAWVDQNLSAIASEFDPAAHPKDGSDYNQHNLDVDATGEMEDELATMIGGPMVAAGDPDWDPSEHPRGPDGKFVESGGVALAAPVSISMSKVQPGMYVSGAGHPNYIKANDMEKIRRVASKKKLPFYGYELTFDDGHTFTDKANAVVKHHAEIQNQAESSDIGASIEYLENELAATSLAKSVAYLKGEDYKAQALQGELEKYQQQLADLKAKKKAGVQSVPAPPAAPIVKKAAPAKPITAWTKTIYSGKYADGEVVAVKDDGSERLVWEGGSKKYQWDKKTPAGWKIAGLLTKKDAYAKFKDKKTSWQSPAPGASVTDYAPPPSDFNNDNGISSQFTILPRDKRGKSGDGYFAGNFWGRYGAAGLMMRHTDEKGEERFLLVQANMRDNPDTYGKWQLPGGALEEFETPEQGAAREAFEELGFNQDFLYKMKQRETHQVSFDVPNYGNWSYSNITVDVPSRPDMKFDPNELGGAKWVTRDELDKMRKGGEIIKPLEANLDSILGKFHPEKPQPTPVKNQPGPTPPVRPSSVTPVAAPMASHNQPAISTQSTAAKTPWTKSKFTQTLAYKHSFAEHEIVGIVDFGPGTRRIVWEGGKFRAYRYESGQGWVYTSTWSSKKAALDTMKDQYFYRPPAGTMADTNSDFIPSYSLKHGNNVITTTENKDFPPKPASDVQVVVSGQIATLKPFNDDGTPFGSYKTSFVGYNADGDKLGGVHEDFNGVWTVAPKGYLSPFTPATKTFTSKEAALKELVDADKAYMASLGARPANPTPAPVPATKKIPKLTAAQIEKQNGTVPKTMKGTQKATFNKNFRGGSPVGNVTSYETDAKKIFTALVFAVKKHNEGNSPKLNFLQGLNVVDQTYGSTHKNKVVTWLQTSEGKALASGIANGLGSTASSSTTNLVPSAYSYGTPQKGVKAFRELSLSDAIDMHEEMEKQRPLTAAEKTAIEDYTDNVADFNNPLRHPEDVDNYGDTHRIKTLQGAMRPLPESIITYRGTDGLGSEINLSKIGTLVQLKKFEGAVLQDPAFLSTSIDKDKSFTGAFKMVISAPKGTPANFAYANASSFYKPEKEMLLAAGLQYRIDRVEQVGEFYGKQFWLYVTVVPEMTK